MAEKASYEQRSLSHVNKYEIYVIGLQSFSIKIPVLSKGTGILKRASCIILYGLTRYII